MITAPYNFVPLNKKVFYPNWAGSISHDIPFEDAMSGQIDITITAKSPIFVRNHSNDKNNPSSEFCNHNGTYYIPGSSLKGVIRTIVEILSFSKLHLQDKRLAYRDLNHPSYKKKAMNTNKIYMGWMYKKDNMVYIENLGKVTDGKTRIKYDEMYNYFDKKLVHTLKRTKEAHKKYAIFKNDNLHIESGTIVFTGSTGNKTREFLFPNGKPKNVYTLKEESEIFKTFLDSYYIGTPNESKDWKNLWSKKFKRGEKIPVFFQLDEKGKLKHFGLSMLYKLPYEYNLQTLLENYQDFREAPDLSELIFGYVNGEKALKGRVNFSHLKATKVEKCHKTALLPLSTPRATFYPSYLEQNPKSDTQIKGNYITYDDPNAILRGFKLYPPQKSATFDEELCRKHSNVCTQFKPLDEGSVFEGKIRFFNLKKIELGALLAALTLCEKREGYHKIGMGKPYGFGTVEIGCAKVVSTDGDDIGVSEMIAHFKSEIEKEIGVDFDRDEHIQTLLALSTYTIPDKKLKYMALRDFANAKKHYNKFYLPKVSLANNTEKRVQPQVNTQNIAPSTSISKNKMKKAITAYWKKKFGIFFHPNQIKEFFSKDGFVTTPKEQQIVYEKLREDKQFIALLKMVEMFYANKMSEEIKMKFFQELESYTRENK